MADFNLFGKTISDIKGFTIPDTNGVDHDFSERIVFTQTWDTEYVNYTLGCNKSYSECHSLLITQNARTCAVFVVAYPTGEHVEYSLNFAGENDGALSFYFIAPYGSVADIDYNEDGTVEYIEPSTHVTSLTVTENGYYSHSGVYSDVTVNVKKAFTANIVSGGTPNRSYVTYNNVYYYIRNDYFGFSAGDTLHIYSNATTYSQIVINGVTVATRNSGGVLEYDYILPSSDIKIDLSGSTASIVTNIWETPVLKTKSITANGTYTASSDSADGYSSVTVNVPGGSSPTLQTKTVTPTTSEQSVTPDTGYDGLSSVTVNAMPSGSMGTPTATKGSVSNHSVSVTPSVTNAAGYISGGTVNGTAITVSASELVSGSETKTTNGTYDVTNLAGVVVDVPVGADVPIFTMQYDPSWDVDTASCTETFVQCRERWDSGTNYLDAAVHTIYDNGDGTFSNSYDVVKCISCTETSIVYTAFIGAVPAYEIVYYSDSRIEVNQQSSASQELTATANGYYFPSNNGVFTNVIVNVPSTTPTLQSKTATPTESQQTVTADSGYDGLSAVTVNAVSSTYVGSGIDRNDSTDLTASGATVTVPAGYYAGQASKAVESGSATTPATSLTANPTISVSASGLITATASATQSVTPTVSAGYVSSGTAGTVTVSGSNTQQLATQAAKTVTPTESEQTAVAANVYTTGVVKVGAVSSTYVGSDITRRSSTDLTASGATVTVPAGYYSEQASKAVSSGSAGTPSASKGTVSNHSVTVTPSVTNTTGYITGGTKTGTAVTVSASELVSGSQTISANGTTDVTNLASVTVAIPFVTYYTGTSEPSASLGSDGDIYLKVVS